MKKYSILILLTLLFCPVGPAQSWYYFTASNGQRMQWSSTYRPLPVYVDSSFDLNHSVIDTILTDWNNPLGHAINLFNTTVDYTTSMDVNTVNQFLQNPVIGQIWIVHDTDGSILQSLGLNRNSILGLGLPFTTGGNPDEIVSGIVIMNAWFFSGDPAGYQTTLLHELGHILGMAHSICAGNMFETVNTGYDNSSLPVMYPFAMSGAATSLQKDDEAGALTMYGN